MMISRLVFAFGLLSATAFTHPALAGSGRALQIIVSRDSQSLAVYDGDQVIATSNVSTGKAGHSTPTGIFSILEKQKYHESNLYSNAPMPYMQRITWSGVALHESASVPRYPASHGCVRLPAKFAKALYQITERGAHVIIADEAVVPVAFAHPTLFKPTYPAVDGELLSDAQLRPTSPNTALKPVELAMNEVLPKVGAAATVVVEDVPPLRILITRRGPRETMLDVQTLLSGLGFDAGVADGHAGALTVAAIKSFKQSKGLAATGALVTPEFLTALYTAAGKGMPPQGQILVRQKFKQLFEAPVVIDQPEIALGTHFIEATKVHRSAGKAEWFAVTLANDLPTAAMKRLGITVAADARAENAASLTLDRLTIPDDIRRRIEPLLSDGSSITISDIGTSAETGEGTDFITLTHTTARSRTKKG